MLVFESQVVPGHDAEYGTASSEIRQLVPRTLEKVVPVVRDTGTALRDGAIRGINESSVVPMATWARRRPRSTAPPPEQPRP